MSIIEKKYIQDTYFKKNPTWDQEDSYFKGEIVYNLLTSAKIYPKNIADIGCGSGDVLVYLRRVFNDCEFYGFDISPFLIQFWKEKVSENINFTCGDFFITNNRNYDIILLLDVIEHLENPHEYLARINKFANYFVFHIPLDLSVNSILREEPLLRARRNVGHIHYFTKNIALDLLQECGYEILYWNYTGISLLKTRHTQYNFLTEIRKLSKFILSDDFRVRLFGGETLIALCRTKQ